MNSTLDATFPQCRFSCFSFFTYSTSIPTGTSTLLPMSSASTSSGDAHANKDRQPSHQRDVRTDFDPLLRLRRDSTVVGNAFSTTVGL